MNLKTLFAIYLAGVVCMFVWLAADAAKNPSREVGDRLLPHGYILWGLLNLLWPIIAAAFLVVLLLEVFV